ncbi:thiol reductant ABC exporter subunit CydD [Sphingomonas sp.]|uniref:thiol reductant ABC exporter subunit CydD n=1 Tax=Sphingomonas sp. TaxID=28214 RepID=UPI003B3A54FB
MNEAATFLARTVKRGDACAPATLLLLDTVAAIGFAGGLAGCIAHVGSGAGAMVCWAALVAACGPLRGVAAMMSARLGAGAAERVKRAVRQTVTAASLRRRSGDPSTSGAWMTAIVDEVDALDGYVARFLPARQAATLAPLIVLLATAIASPIAAAILLGTLVPFVAVMALAGGAAKQERDRQFVALARLSGRFADRLRAMPVILAFRQEEAEARLLGLAAEELARRTMRVLRVAFLSSGGLEFFAALSVALVAVYAGFNLLGLLPFPVPETLSLPRAFFVLALAPEFYAPMRRLAAAYHDRQAAESAAARLRAHKVPDKSPNTALPAQAPKIDFDDVTISYGPGEVPAIAHFSLTVASGETVALLGPSGSGKSSLLHLLLGLAPLSGGRVTIDGSGLSPDGGLSPSCAWAGQAPLIIPGTIRDNLLLARPSATPAAVGRAIRDVGLDPMLDRRAGGINAVLDERGSALSGGERRRIALARALLKDAPVLLLDEPTAHLDHASERGLVQAIRAACRGRTTLIATHSPLVASVADRIVRL